MATFTQIYNRAQDGNIRAQISVAITNEAKYAIQNSQDPDTINWAVYAVPNAYKEATNWQMLICTDTVIADAVEVRDEDVAAAVTAIVPTMVSAYKQTIA